MSHLCYVEFCDPNIIRCFEKKWPATTANCFATSAFELVIILAIVSEESYPGVIVGHARRQRSPQNAAPAVDLNFTLMQRVKSGPVW